LIDVGRGSRWIFGHGSGWWSVVSVQNVVDSIFGISLVE
jgi:hypothetical protein